MKQCVKIEMGRRYELQVLAHAAGARRKPLLDGIGCDERTSRTPVPDELAAREVEELSIH